MGCDITCLNKLFAVVWNAAQQCFWQSRTGEGRSVIWYKNKDVISSERMNILFQ